MVDINETKPVTSVSDWKKSSSHLGPAPLDLPSGKTCLCRAPGVDAFVKLGMVPNSLLQLIVENTREGQKPKPEAMIKEVADNPQRIADLMGFVDRVTVYSVVEPQITEIPESYSDRSEDLLYVDEVDMEDKMFVFQFAVGGTRDLERFREEQAAGMAAVSNLQDTELPAQLTT